MSVFFKRILVYLLCVIMSFTAATAPTDAAGSDAAAGPTTDFAPDIKVYVNGKLLETDVPPIIYDDRTLVPIRAISEAIGCKVEWFDADERIVIYTPVYNDPFMEMHIDDHNVKIMMYDYKYDPPVVWAEDAVTDVRPMLYNDRTLLPLRFVAEWMGFAVEWAEAEQAVYIKSIDDEELRKKLTGLWHGMNMVAAGFDERYAFYEDGVFVHASSMADTGPERFRMGTWDVIGGRLVFLIQDWCMATDRYIKNDYDVVLTSDSDYTFLRGYTIINESITFPGFDPDTGREMLEINYQTFYSFNNQDNLMSDYDEIIERYGFDMSREAFDTTGA